MASKIFYLRRQISPPVRLAATAWATVCKQFLCYLALFSAAILPLAATAQTWQKIGGSGSGSGGGAFEPAEGTTISCSMPHDYSSGSSTAYARIFSGRVQTRAYVADVFEGTRDSGWLNGKTASASVPYTSASATTSPTGVSGSISVYSGTRTCTAAWP